MLSRHLMERVAVLGDVHLVLVRQAHEVSAIRRCSAGAGLRRQQDAVGWHLVQRAGVGDAVVPVGRHLVIVRGGAELGVAALGSGAELGIAALGSGAELGIAALGSGAELGVAALGGGAGVGVAALGGGAEVGVAALIGLRRIVRRDLWAGLSTCSVLRGRGGRLKAEACLSSSHGSLREETVALHSSQTSSSEIDFEQVARCFEGLQHRQKNTLQLAQRRGDIRTTIDSETEGSPPHNCMCATRRTELPDKRDDLRTKSAVQKRQGCASPSPAPLNSRVLSPDDMPDELIMLTN